MLELHLKLMPQKAIARTLGVSQPTVSRDLAYLRDQAAAEPLSEDAAVELGEALALADEIRATALDEHARLEAEPKAPGAVGTAARLDCLRVAVRAQNMRLGMLGRAGLLAPRPESRKYEGMTAREIVARLKAAGLR